MAKVNDENAHEYSHFTAKPGVLGVQTPFSTKHTQQIGAGSVRKQVFSELHNVIHGTATPARGLRPSVSICNDGLRKQNVVPAQKAKKQVKLQSHSLEDDVKDKEEENLFDYFDFGSCREDCRKSDQEIWSEMNLIVDDIIDKVLRGGDPDSEDEFTDMDVKVEREDRSCPSLDDLDITAYMNLSTDVDVFVPLPPSFEIDEHGDVFDPYIM